jgi:hypothetical protein
MLYCKVRLVISFEVFSSVIMVACLTLKQALSALYLQPLYLLVRWLWHFLNVFLSLYIFLSFCLSVSLSLCLYIFLSFFLSFCVSVSISFCLSVFLSFCVSVGIHQTIQKNSVGFIPWDGITVGKDQIP